MPTRQPCHTEECTEEAAEGEDYCDGCCAVMLDFQRDLNKARAGGEGLDWWGGLNLTLDVIHGRIGRKMFAEGHV